MTDQRMFSKGTADRRSPEEDGESSDYYYDDATGYRIYDGEQENDDDDDEDDEFNEASPSKRE